MYGSRTLVCTGYTWSPLTPPSCTAGPVAVAPRTLPYIPEHDGFIEGGGDCSAQRVTSVWQCVSVTSLLVLVQC
jgi:hypothetical protein